MGSGSEGDACSTLWEAIVKEMQVLHYRKC
jgi:hypothetical protein